MKQNHIIQKTAVLMLGMGSLLLLSPIAFAQTDEGATPPAGGSPTLMHRGGGKMIQGGHMMKRAGVFGTVSTVNGTTLTVTKDAMRGETPGTNGTTPFTYTVDASNATVEVNGVSSSLQNIAVGSRIIVDGTVTGTQVVATHIRSGMPQGTMMGGPRGEKNLKDTMMPTGNGQPVVGGTVTSINGTTVNITNPSQVTYAIDTTHANIIRRGATSTVQSIVVGDRVMVQGTINGTSVLATQVIDRGAPQVMSVPPVASNTEGTTGNVEGGEAPKGIMGGVQNFFHRVFGFF